MKYLFVTLTALVLGGAAAQKPLIDKSGTAYFYSEAPLEDIEATNENVIGAIDLTRGTLAVSMFIKDFHFDKSLMEEHFNENYLESEKFPKAKFKGKIKDLSHVNFAKSGAYEAEVDGEIEIHGVSKPIQTTVFFEIADKGLGASTTFHIEIADFDIKIPKLVMRNIAEVVEVKASFNFNMTE